MDLGVSLISKNMKIHIFLLYLSLQATFLQAQTKAKPLQFIANKNQLNISLGLGFEDGLVFLSKNAVPTFGISYERKLSKRLFFASHILTHYRTFLNPTNIDTHPFLSKFRGANSPFMTQADKDKLNNSGIKQLNRIHTFKSLSLPVDVGFNLYPLSTKHHRLGLNVAFSMTFENHNWWTDQFTGVLTLADGTQKQITLEVPTEFRTFAPGFSTKILYDYSFKDYSIGFKAANYNVFLTELAGSKVQPIWETSLYLGFKF